MLVFPQRLFDIKGSDPTKRKAPLACGLNESFLQAQFGMSCLVMLEIFFLMLGGSSQFIVSSIKQWDPGGNFYLHVLDRKNK